MEKNIPLGIAFFLLVVSGSCDPFRKEDSDYDYYGLSEDEEPPTFISRSQHFTVEVGQSVILPCRVKNKGDHVLIMKRQLTSGSKEQLLAVGGMKVLRVPRFIVDDSKLTISRVRPRDSGTYSCSFSTVPDTVLNHTLDVQYPPSLTVPLPSHHIVPKGALVRLRCDAMGNPVPSVRWSRVEGNLPSGATTHEGNELLLDAVDRHTEGTYVCAADNGVGEPASANVSVVVEYKPEIRAEKSVVRTGDGDQVELVCLVWGHPRPHVSWTRNGKPIDGAMKTHTADSMDAHRHSLSVTPLSEADFGSYVCIAENSQGEESAVIQMTGLPKEPEVASEPSGGESDSYTFIFQTESYYPVIEFRLLYRKSQTNQSANSQNQWQDILVTVDKANTIRIKGSNEYVYRYTLRGLQAATDYEAVVRARNKYGWSSDSGIFSFSTRKEMAVQQSTRSGFFSSSAQSVIIVDLSIFVLCILLLHYFCPAKS